MRKHWIVMAAATVVMGSLLTSGFAEDNDNDRERGRRRRSSRNREDGERGDQRRGRGGDRKKPDAAQRAKGGAFMLINAVGELPEAKEAVEQHAKTVETLHKEIREIMQAAMRKAHENRDDEGGEDARKEVMASVKKQTLPITEKMIEANIEYCEKLLKIARQNKKLLAAKFVDRMGKGRRRGRRGKDGQDGDRRRRRGGRDGDDEDGGQRRRRRPAKDKDDGDAVIE